MESLYLLRDFGYGLVKAKKENSYVIPFPVRKQRAVLNP